MGTHKSISRFIGRILSGLVLFLVVFSCANPAGGDSGGGNSDTITAPGNVQVLFGSGKVTVTWDSVVGAAEYELYRKDGDGTYVLVTTTSQTQYVDTAYPSDKTFCYAVSAFNVSRSMASPLSSPSDSLTEWVRDVTASKHEYSNKIVLNWSKHASAETYRIYRVASLSDTPVMIAEIFDPNTLTYTDNLNAGTVDYNKPYFYQVRWSATSVEHGDSAPETYGVFFGTVDHQEPDNNDVANFNVDDATFTYAASNPPVMYSFGDGDNGVVSDTDWFKYKGPSDQDVVVKVKVPSSTFLTGELKLQFYYNNTYETVQSVTCNGTEQVFIFNNFGGATGDVDVFLKIYPVVPSSRNVITDYSVNISNSL